MPIFQYYLCEAFNVLFDIVEIKAIIQLRFTYIYKASYSNNHILNTQLTFLYSYVIHQIMSLVNASNCVPFVRKKLMMKLEITISISASDEALLY